MYLVTMRLTDGTIETKKWGTIASATHWAAKFDANVQAVHKIKR